MTSAYNFADMGPSDAVHREQQLIRFSQNGDRDAFASLYETHLGQIYRYIYFRVYEHELAEDLTSVVFLKVWEHLGSFESGNLPFVGWIYRIAHNTVIDYYRTRKITTPLEDVHPRQLSHVDDVDDRIDIEILSHQLMQALDEVTSTQREVLILRFIWGLTTTEIADTLKKRRGAIRALQMRGLKRMAGHPAIREEHIYERRIDEIFLREVYMLNVMIWMIVGALIGWAASILVRTDNYQGLLSDILVGIVGAFAGGYLLTPLFGIGAINNGDFSLPALLVSLGGAILVLLFTKIFRSVLGYVIFIMIAMGIYVYFDCWTVASTSNFCSGVRALSFLQ